MLHLVLKGIWYDAIASGEKTVEYRDNTVFWRKRIKPDSGIQKMVTFHRGYTYKIMIFKIRAVVFNVKQIEIHLGERLN